MFVELPVPIKPYIWECVLYGLAAHTSYQATLPLNVGIANQGTIWQVNNGLLEPVSTMHIPCWEK